MIVHLLWITLKKNDVFCVRKGSTAFLLNLVQTSKDDICLVASQPSKPSPKKQTLNIYMFAYKRWKKVNHIAAGNVRVGLTKTNL